MNLWIVPILGFALFAGNEIANPRAALLGKVYWKGDRRAVALTFDDGPHPLYTPRILEILERCQAKATFFVIGRHLEKHGNLVAQAVQAGHVVGNHSYSHFRMMSFSSVPRIRKEIQNCQEAVAEWAGYVPRFYRQPAGFRNPMLFSILKELGMTLVGWQARAFDTQRRSPQDISRNILGKAKPGGIILLHDGGDSPRNDDRKPTIAALPEIVKRLKDQGLEFLTLDRHLGLSKEITTDA